MKMRVDNLLSSIAAFLGLVILGLYVTIPESAGAEYTYTIQVIFNFSFLPLCLAALLLNSHLRRWSRQFMAYRHNVLIMGILGSLLLCVPLLSPPAVFLAPQVKTMLSVCWIVGGFFVCMCVFAVAAKLGNMFSGLLCLVASLILFFVLAELYYAATRQFQDTYVQDNKHSKYVLADQAQATLPMAHTEKWAWPIRPTHHTHAAAHREVAYGRPLFDVRYIFDENARRTLPPVSQTPKADVLLFGCSFTFGFGLENEQTWAWKLSLDLGPDWRIANYAYLAFGAQQMLDMAEDGFVAQPSAPFRQALFLAISGHLYRAVGLMDMFSSRYVLRDGVAVREGVITDSPYNLLISVPAAMNGSQAAREIAGRLAKYIRTQKHDEFLAIYISLLEQAARVLKERYDTPLTVLVWPDIEEIIPELQKRGVSVLPMRQFLPEWEDPYGNAYHIVKDREFHPNELATDEMAAALARWLREQYDAREQQ